MPLWPAIKQRVGRRGVALSFLALLDGIYAWTILSAPPTPAYDFLGSLLPLPYWAGLWAAVGLLCAVQAWTHSDRLAFAFASLLKVTWAMIHLLGWIIADLPRGWLSPTIWLAFAGFVAVIAGWRENGDR